MIPFSVDANGWYYHYWRMNCGDGSTDSFWMKTNDGAFEQRNGRGTEGWGWLTMNNYNPVAGEHTLTIGYRENGAKLDKIQLSTVPFPPDE